MARVTNAFLTIRTEGAILPHDVLRRIADGDRGLPGLRAEDYGLAPGEKLNEAISRSWNRLSGLWRLFRTTLDRLPEADLATGETRRRWLLPLLDELRFGQVPVADALTIDGRPYPISHLWRNVPIHLVGARVDLDRRTPGVAGAARSSPHSLVQEFLNRSGDHVWGVVSNGLRLRLLRDNVSLTRQAYVEFDLEAVFDGEVYPDFVVLWLTCHATRMTADRPEDFFLEKWSKFAREQGARALDQLRDGVQRSLEALGRGFLSHPANSVLRERLRSDDLDRQDYYRQVLRLVYRLLFLFVAEDRDLLMDPGAPAEARRRYLDHYALGRLRRLAERRRGSRHGDLWQALRLVFRLLGADVPTPSLGLYPLGSFLWSDAATPDLMSSELANADLLESIRALAFIRDRHGVRPVDFRNLRSEELGSVYESLLELHPEVNIEAATFSLTTASGHERKTTGSYYTPESLVQCLLDSALDPVLDEAVKKDNPAAAILALKVCDPACGSGHFLIAAAHRMARRLAAVRTGDEEPSPKATYAALRDVVGHCIYGVDINPMAVELCKIALWMEALEPGKPLSFLEHRVRCGNSLLGATPALLARGIPDEAFTPIEGDDKKVCSEWKKRNKKERTGQQSLFTATGMPWDRLGDHASAMLDLIGTQDDTIEGLRKRQQQYEALVRSDAYLFDRLWADAWCAAFVWRKVTGAALPYPVTHEVFRRIQQNPWTAERWMRDEVRRLAEQYQFFHWHLEFPDVFRPAVGAVAEDDPCGWDGGFDVVLGNPPWDTLSPDQREFFGQWRPDMRSLSPEEQGKVVADILSDAGIASAWAQHCRDLFALVHFLKNSGRFTLYAPGNLGKGDFNVYRMFVEAALRGIRDGGYAGQIVPGGLYGGANASAIRRFMLDHCRLEHLFGLINTKRGWFEQVDIDRFCAYVARGAGRTESFLAQFGLAGPEDLANVAIVMDADVVRQQAPATYAIPDTRAASDVTVSAKMYQRHPAFGDATAGPPIRHYQREVDMGTDNGLFTTDPAGLPVYEGRMIDHFDHRAKTYVSGHGNSSVWQQRAFGDPEKAIVPQWRVLRRDVPSKLGDRVDRYRIGFGDVANPRNERSFMAALVPPATICGHTVPTIVFERHLEWAFLPWLAVANSFVMDALVRKKLSSPHMTYSILDSLPFPKPSLTDPWVHHVAPLVLRLTCTAPEMTPFWNAMAVQGLCDPVPDGSVPPSALIDEQARFLVRAEIDAVVASDVFGISRQELSDILDTFPVVKKRDEKAYGEFRTKLAILAAFDRLQRTPDLPPADPRVAHPAERAARGTACEAALDREAEP